MNVSVEHSECIQLMHEKSDNSLIFNYNHLLQSMKDKFSYFSPPVNKNNSFQTSINFQATSNKLTPFDSLNQFKEPSKININHSLSYANIDHLRKQTKQETSLRQTLSYKQNNSHLLTKDSDRNIMPKPSSYLRQTISNLNAFKPKTQKSFSQSFTCYNSHSSINVNHIQDHQNLSYSRKTSPIPLFKSNNSTKQSPVENSLDELRKKLNEGNFKHSGSDCKKEKLQHQIKLLKKLSEHLQRDEESSSKELFEKNMPLSKMAQKKETPKPNLFRKKQNLQDHYNDCFTPKLPKNSYEERFKKVESPTSTNNSDSKSPSNRFVEVFDQEKKTSKLSIQEFDIIKSLGQGKFGVVMMAKHRKTGSLFALKKIPKEMIKSHMMIDQLALEIRLQTCLNHKNVLGIYGFFDDSTHFYIVLEYMENGTLYSELKKNKILPQKEAATIIKQVASAVEYLHDRDIAHRDIKPQNIVISNSVYKLCDFGWATICNQRRKTYCGTFDYAAPQILEGKQYDMSVDLWCLGILTYQLLTGKAPFYHLSRKETMRRILNCEAETITYSQSMSIQVIDFIEKLIRKNPQQRMKASQALKHKFLAEIEL